MIFLKLKDRYSISEKEVSNLASSMVNNLSLSEAREAINLNRPLDKVLADKEVYALALAFSKEVMGVKLSELAPMFEIDKENAKADKVESWKDNRQVNSLVTRIKSISDDIKQYAIERTSTAL